MKAARLHAIGDFRVDEIDIPEVSGEELLLNVGACGICGSDIPRIFTLGTSRQDYPLTIGHEFAGTIEIVGPNADQSLVGKRGAIFPCIPCRECSSCQSGNYVMCENYGYLGSRNNGGFADYCLIPSAWHFIESSNPDLPIEALAMTEPCTVAQHSIRKGGVSNGQYVAIFGAGPIGIMTARWATLFGAKPILFDVVDEKIEFARERGCQAYSNRSENPADVIKRITGGKLADVTIEGTGYGSALGQCVECTKTFGTIVLMGNPVGDTQIALSQHSLILRKELTIVGIWNSHFFDIPINEWKVTVENLDNCKMIVTDLITHRSDLDGLPALCDGIHDRSINICKALFVK